MTSREQQPALATFAVGLIGLGVLAIFAAPTRLLPWTAFFITWFFASSAWVVSRNTPSSHERK